MKVSLVDYFVSANTQGLTDGGIAGLFWSFVWTFLGFGIVMLSLAEMASRTFSSRWDSTSMDRLPPSDLQAQVFKQQRFGMAGWIRRRAARGQTRRSSHRERSQIERCGG